MRTFLFSYASERVLLSFDIFGLSSFATLCAFSQPIFKSVIGFLFRIKFQTIRSLLHQDSFHKININHRK